MKTYMFPGQGSQARGMGEGLFDDFPELTAKADKILGYSIKALCLEDGDQTLGKTQFTQPALYVVNMLSYYRKLAETDGAEPDFLAGHSLGELCALTAAGCFEFETGLKLVKKRGELMAQVANGAMAAVLNGSREEIERILRENGLENVDIANYNSPSQIVISGLVDEIQRAKPLFEQGAMLFFPLNTSGAFHSRFMRAARDKFQLYLKKFKLAEPRIPVIANVTAREYGAGQVASLLPDQIASTVRWSESVEYLMAKGAAAGTPMHFEELGHGRVLTKLVQAIERHVAKASAADRENRASAAQSSPSSPANDAAAELSTAPSETQSTLSVQDRVARWNASYSVGTKVRSTAVDYGVLETRTEAMVLFGHRAAIYMKDYGGYFDLDELAPA